MKHQIQRRTLSALMAGVLCFSCMCSPAFAAGDVSVPESAASVNQMPVESAEESTAVPESESAQAVSGAEQAESTSTPESTSNEAVSESDTSAPRALPRTVQTSKQP
ncbi:MAG: hypothetical protein ACLSBB_15955 [Ruthenibacterium lactatiformans]